MICVSEGCVSHSYEIFKINVALFVSNNNSKETIHVTFALNKEIFIGIYVKMNRELYIAVFIETCVFAAF